MTQPNDGLPSLSLLPNAASALNAPTAPPHHDSEAFLRNDRHRTAQELENILDDDTRGHASSRDDTRGSTCRAGAPLSRRASQISTATDTSARGHLQLRRQKLRWYDGVVRFWRREVNITIEEGAYRDHLALERTFLSYLRTSVALAITGVVTAQLFRVQHALAPNPRIGYFVLGVPLAAAFISLGIIVLLVGAVRFWRQQRALCRGTVYAGGWEVVGVMGASLLMCAVTFAMLVWVDVDKSYKS